MKSSTRAAAQLGELIQKKEGNVKEICHEYTGDVVCPLCGHEHSDSYEMSEGIQECHHGYETKTYPGKDHLVYRRCKNCDQYKWLDKGEAVE
jgi:uncharacterized Zn finger protein (UPF0148 family)